MSEEKTEKEITPPPNDGEKKEAVVQVMIGFQCPNPECGEQIGQEEEVTLSEANKFRAEIAAEDGECPLCETKVFNRKYVIKGF